MDPHQRRIELEHKKATYKYAVNAPGLPAQVENLPEDENFSDSYKVIVFGWFLPSIVSLLNCLFSLTLGPLKSSSLPIRT